MNPYDQSGVLAYHFVNGELRVLLITSNKRKRWIIPKGIVEPYMSAAESAEKEAWEEAGVVGQISDHVLGTYTYEKWGGICVVKVFPLKVTRIAERWPESHRERAWFALPEAADQVEEPDLQAILRSFPQVLDSLA